MSSRKVFIIWNPASGGKSEKIIKSFNEYISAQKIEFKIHDTSETKNASKTVSASLDHTYSDLVIIGGDGTINESINGLSYDIPISVIPAGTGDDFIKMIEIGKSQEEIFETALFGKIQKIDLGVCNGRKFINGVGIGFDGQIVEDMAVKRIPFLKGHAAYYYHVLKILGGYLERPFIYSIDKVDYKKELILLTVGNGSTFGGGFKLMPDAKLDDGLLEICEIGRFPPLKRFLNIHRLSNGTHGVLPRVNFYQTKEITVKSDAELFAHIDGERMGSPPYVIKVLPKNLRIRLSTY